MGCDVITWLHSAQLRYFNPRTHMGCDNVWEPGVANWSISIHAPTWGATVPFHTGFPVRLYFNPRTHMGCDYFNLYKP